MTVHVEGEILRGYWDCLEADLLADLQKLTGAVPPCQNASRTEEAEAFGVEVNVLSWVDN